MAPTLEQRYGFAVKHLIAAARFARLCHEVEPSFTGKDLPQFRDEITSYVSASVFLSVAALEANLNELVADIRDGTIWQHEVTNPLLQSVNGAGFYSIFALIDKVGLLEKYQVALMLLAKGQMDKSREPYQSVDTLIDVRNVLVHYKPEWQSEQRQHRRLGERLRGKFKMSLYSSEDEPIFPIRCMTYGLADWAVQSSLTFSRYFAQAAGVPNRFDRFTERLKTTA